MKKIVFGVQIVFLLGACHPNNHYSDLKSWRADVKAIRTWIENYTEAINTADIERILSYESDDIFYFPPNQPSFSGKENLRKWFLSYFNYFSPTESLVFRHFDVFDDFAYLNGIYTIHGKIKQTGEEFIDKGKFTNFYKRLSDGNWICTQSIWNSDSRTFDIHSQILDDFSGSWNLDISKSTILPDLISSNLIISQKGNELNINRINEKTDKEIERSSFNYTIGSEIQNKLKSGVFTTISSFSSGKQTFTIKETLITEKNGLKQEYKRITIYTLYARGEVLDIISDEIHLEGSTTQLNKKHMELIYTKM